MRTCAVAAFSRPQAPADRLQTAYRGCWMHLMGRIQSCPVLSTTCPLTRSSPISLPPETRAVNLTSAGFRARSLSLSLSYCSLTVPTVFLSSPIRVLPSFFFPSSCLDSALPIRCSAAPKGSGQALHNYLGFFFQHMHRCPPPPALVAYHRRRRNATPPPLRQEPQMRYSPVTDSPSANSSTLFAPFFFFFPLLGWPSFCALVPLAGAGGKRTPPQRRLSLRVDGRSRSPIAPVRSLCGTAALSVPFIVKNAATRPGMLRVARHLLASTSSFALALACRRLHFPFASSLVPSLVTGLGGTVHSNGTCLTRHLGPRDNVPTCRYGSPDSSALQHPIAPSVPRSFLQLCSRVSSSPRIPLFPRPSLGFLLQSAAISGRMLTRATP